MTKAKVECKLRVRPTFAFFCHSRRESQTVRRNICITKVKNILLKNLTLAIQIHQLLRFSALIIVGIILTKSGVELATIGQLEGLQYIGAALSIFWVNGFVQGALPYYPSLENEAKKLFLNGLYFVFLFFSTLIFILLYIFSNQISLFFSNATLPYLSLFAVYLLLYLPSNLLEYIYLLKEKSQALLVSSGLTFLAICGSCFAFFYGEKNLAYLLYVWIAIAFFRHLFLLFELKNVLDFSFDKKIMSSYLVLSLPLLAYAFVGQYAINFDAWLVNFHYKGDAEKFTIFRYGSRELPFFLALATGLSNSMTVKIAAETPNILSILKEKTARLMHLCFPLAMLLLASSNYWFCLVFSRSFEASIVIFDVFILLIISRLLFPQSILLAKKESKSIFIISIIELLVNAILSIVLIQKFGLAGVAFGTFIAFLLEKILLAFWLWKKYNIRFETYTPVKYWLFYSLLIIVIFMGKYFL